MLIPLPLPSTFLISNSLPTDYSCFCWSNTQAPQYYGLYKPLQVSPETTIIISYLFLYY